MLDSRVKKSFRAWLLISGFLVLTALLSFILRAGTGAESVVIHACYQQYACENCLHMKVIKVSRDDFRFLVGQDVFPSSTRLNVEDFVTEHHRLPARPFVLTGRLLGRKRDTLALALEPEAYDFQVEQIEYLSQSICP